MFCILLEMGSQVGIYSELAQNQVSGGVADLRLSCYLPPRIPFPLAFFLPNSISHWPVSCLYSALLLSLLSPCLFFKKIV